MQSQLRILMLTVAAAVGFLTNVQAQTAYDTSTFVSRADASLGYQYIRSNAPPNGQPTFTAQGGFGELHALVWRYLGAAVEVTDTQASDISALGQNLSLLTYTAGPRATLQGGRISLYAEALFGAAHGSDSYFPTATGYTSSANSFAYSGGGGVDYNISHSWAVRGEIQYLHTGFPNGVNDSQQHLTLGAGLVYRMGGHYSHPHGRRASHLPAEPEVQPMPMATAPPPQAEDAAASAAPAMVITPIIPTAPVPLEDRSSAEFRTHIKNVHFDRGSYGLNVDALSALAHAATYLRLHASVRVNVGSTSTENDIRVGESSLTQRRLSAVREALIAGGIAAERITITLPSAASCVGINEECSAQPDVITLTEEQ